MKGFMFFDANCRIGVKRLVFSHHLVLWGEMRNAEVIEMIKPFDGLFRVYVGINPHFQENIKEDLALFDSWAPHAVGLKILAGYHRVKVSDKITEDDMRNILYRNARKILKEQD